MVNPSPTPVNEAHRRPHLSPTQGASRRTGAYGGTFDICGKTSTLHQRHNDAACARTDALSETVNINHPSSWVPPKPMDNRCHAP